MRAAVIFVAGVLGLVLVASYGGAWHGLGDALAVFRLPIAALFALVVIWADWPRALRWPLAALALLAMGQIVALRFDPGQAGPVTVYQKNLLFRNPAPEAVVADILARAPDVVMLQEVSGPNLAVLDALAKAYPSQLICPFAGVGAVAVLSRWPRGQGLCPDRTGLAAMQVTGPDGPVWLVSLHLHWPWPFGQRPQVQALLPVLEALEGPVIVAGDFNMVPWGWSVREVARATGTQRAGALAPTLWKRGVPLPIDHVLAPFGGSSEVLETLGSDHNGVLARVALP